MVTPHVRIADHPLDDAAYVEQCRHQLHADGALVLRSFFHLSTIEQIVAQSTTAESQAFYAGSTHNVYLTDPDNALPADHAFNRQVASSKGLIADDQVPADSPLRAVYDDDSFRSFLCGVIGIEAIYSYADELSSINVHFAEAGRELGWHFDNSSFAVTMLLQAPQAGGVFEYVPNVRNAEAGEAGFAEVDAVLDGVRPVQTLSFSPGDLVLFRGRNALHRVTPTIGDTTRILAVLAFNDEPGVRLSESALATFYGRNA